MGDESETRALHEAVKAVGLSGWNDVSKHMSQEGVARDALQCQSHWKLVGQCGKAADEERLEQAQAQMTTAAEVDLCRLGDRWSTRDRALDREFEALLYMDTTAMQQTEEDSCAVHNDFGKGLIMYAPMLACWLSSRRSLASPPCTLLPQLIQEDFMIGLSAFFRTPMIDRTGTLNRQCMLRLSVLDPCPPKDPSFAKGLATIMDERAQTILRRAQEQNVDIEVLWSGGIDSTSLTVALLKALFPEWRPLNSERFPVDVPYPSTSLIVKCSAESVAEYPWFHHAVLLPLSEAGLIVLEPISDTEEVTQLWSGPQERITLTGECGDQIFGSQLLEAAFVETELKALYEHGLDAPWQDTVLASLLDMGIVRPADKDAWLMWFEPFLQRSPVPIVTTFDLLWWLNIACKWQTVCLRLFQRRPTLSWADLHRIVHFFQTEDFQQWSFDPANHASKMPDHLVWSSYKQPLKQYIFDYTSDSNYFENKLKAGSLCQVNDASQFVILGIDDQLNIIRFGDACLSRCQMERKYPDNCLSRSFVNHC